MIIKKEFVAEVCFDLICSQLDQLIFVGGNDVSL